MRMSDWSSDVCSSDLLKAAIGDDFVGNIGTINGPQLRPALDHWQQAQAVSGDIGKAARDDRGLPEPCEFIEQDQDWDIAGSVGQIARVEIHQLLQEEAVNRSEEQTSELQSLMSNSYDVFRLKKKKQNE